MHPDRRCFLPVPGQPGQVTTPADRPAALRLLRRRWVGPAAVLLAGLASAPASAVDYPLGKVIDIVDFEVQQSGTSVLPLNLNPKKYSYKYNHGAATSIDKTDDLVVENTMDDTVLSKCQHCELLVFSDCPERLVPGYFASANGVALYETRVPVLLSQGQTRFRLTLNHELDPTMGSSSVVFYVIFQNKVPGGKIDVYQARKGWARRWKDPVGAGKLTAQMHMTSDWSPELLVTLDEVGGTTNKKAFRLGGTDTNHPSGEIKAEELLSATYDYVAIYNRFQGSPPDASLLVKVVAVKLTSPATDPLDYLTTPQVAPVPAGPNDDQDSFGHIRGTFRHHRREIRVDVAPTPTEPWYFNFGRKPGDAADPPFLHEYEQSTDATHLYLLGNYGVSHNVRFTVKTDDPLLFVVSARSGAVAAAPAFGGHGVFWQPGEYRRCYWEGPDKGDCEDPPRAKEVSNIKALQYAYTGGPAADYREGMVVGKVPGGMRDRVVHLDFIPVNGITTPIQLTVVNMAGEAQSEAGSGTTQGQVVLFDTHGTILPGARRTYPFDVRPQWLLDGSGSPMPLTVDLTWPGSDMKLTLVDPNGQTIAEGSLPAGVTRTKTGASEQFVVASPAAGLWTMHADAVDVPVTGEPFSLAMAVPTMPQANCSLTLTPPTGSVDPLGTLQLTASGGTPPYTWMVTANNSGSTVSATGLFTAGSTEGLTDTITVFDGGGCLPAASTILVATAPAYQNGDVNGDGNVNVADVFYLINGLFAGGPPPVGPADSNGSGGVDVADVFYLINYLFAGGPAPLG